MRMRNGLYNAVKKSKHFLSRAKPFNIFCIHKITLIFSYRVSAGCSLTVQV